MFEKYVGIPYDLFNKHGLNCWALVALVYSDFFSEALPNYMSVQNSSQAISAAFTAAFTEGNHGFVQVDEPADFDVIVMKRMNITHCGIWHSGKVLHAAQKAGQVILQKEADAAKIFNIVEYWRKSA